MLCPVPCSRPRCHFLQRDSYLRRAKLGRAQGLIAIAWAGQIWSMALAFLAAEPPLFPLMFQQQGQGLHLDPDSLGLIARVV